MIGEVARWIVSACLAVSVVMISPIISSGGNSKTHKAGANATVAFGQLNLEVQTHDAFHENNELNIAPTDVSPALFHDTSNQGREVNVIDFRPGTYIGYYGIWRCRDINADGTICWDAMVEINMDYYYSDSDLLSLLCEEVGHAVGLAHQPQPPESSSCMSQDFSDTRLTLHDKSIINGKY